MVNFFTTDYGVLVTNIDIWGNKQRMEIKGVTENQMREGQKNVKQVCTYKTPTRS